MIRRPGRVTDQIRPGAVFHRQDDYKENGIWLFESRRPGTPLASLGRNDDIVAKLAKRSIRERTCPLVAGFQFR